MTLDPVVAAMADLVEASRLREEAVSSAEDAGRSLEDVVLSAHDAGLTLAEIGAVLGLSVGRISQMAAAARGRRGES